MGNVLQFPRRRGSLVLKNGDERLVTWLKACAALADALGIDVEISGEPRFTISARHAKPLLTWEDAHRAQDEDDPL